MVEKEIVGYIVGGSLRDGLRVRLTVPASELQEGSFVVCDSGQWRFYGLVTDLELGSTDPRFADERMERLHPALSGRLYGQTLYTTMEVFATLMLDRGPDDPHENMNWREQIEAGLIDRPSPRPVKTVPAHHAPVGLADAGDVAETASVVDLFRDQYHPYTRGLLASVPKRDQEGELKPIPGTVPNLVHPPSGCRFHPRCPHAKDICSRVRPITIEKAPNHFVACHLYYEHQEQPAEELA